MSEPIETLFLDAGGVLVEPSWPRVAAVLARHGIRADSAALREAEPPAKRAMDAAHVIKRTHDAARAWIYFALVLEHAGVSAPEAALERASAELYAEHAEANLWDVVMPGVPEALERLAGQGRPIVVVSNANGAIESLLGRLGLSRFFAHVVDSTVVGVEKPDPRIFEIALETAGARAATTLHVGDLYHVDVLGARAAGVRPMLLDPASLYSDADCPRVRSLDELASSLGALRP